MDPNIFVFDRYQSADPARAVCRRCPELEPCRAWALVAPPELAGVWGGLSEDDRRQLRSGALTMTDLDPTPNRDVHIATNGSASEYSDRSCVICEAPVPLARAKKGR